MRSAPGCPARSGSTPGRRLETTSSRPFSESDRARVEHGARKVLRAMYNATQEDLPGDKETLPNFLLYRGLRGVKETTIHGELEVGKLPASQIRATKAVDRQTWFVNFQRAATAEEVDLLSKRYPQIREATSDLGLSGYTVEGKADYGTINLAPGVSWTTGSHYRTLNSAPDARNKVPDVNTDNGVIIYSLSIGEQTVRQDAGVRPFYRWADFQQYPNTPGKAALLFGPQRQVTIEDRNVANLVAELKASGYPDIPTARAKLVEQFTPMFEGDEEKLAQFEENLDAAIAAFSEAGWDTGSIEEADANIRRRLESESYRDKQVQKGGILNPVTISTDVTPGWLVGEEAHVADDVRANPMSSHATTIDATRQFGDITVASIVPREDIIGLPGAGYGCLEENEVVVLGRTRRHVVKPGRADMPEPSVLLRMLEAGEVSRRPDIPLQAGEPERLINFLDPNDPWWQKPVGPGVTTVADIADSFYYTTKDWNGNSVAVDLNPLAKWVDQNAVFEQDGEYRHGRFTLFLNNVVRDDLSGKLVQFQIPAGVDDLDAQQLWRSFQDANTRGMFGGNTTFHFSEMDEPYFPPGEDPSSDWPIEPADKEWAIVVANVMDATGTSKGDATNLASAIIQALEMSPDTNLVLEQGGPPAVFRDPGTGITYQISNIHLTQGQLTQAQEAVEGFFVNPLLPLPDLSNPFENDPGAPGPSLLTTENQIAFAFGQLLTDAGHAPPVIQQFTQVMANLVEAKPDTKFLRVDNNTVQDLDTGDQYEFPGLDIPSQGALDAAIVYLRNFMGLPIAGEDLFPGPNPSEKGFAEADAPQPYIFIDGPEEADWPKRTWDFHDINSAAELDAYLARTHESAEHFISQPVFYLGLDDKPAWLRLWAMQHTGRSFADWAPAAHPRWPSGDKRGGQFRPKLGAVVRGAVDPDLIKDIEDILTDVLGPEKPEVDVGDYEVGDLVTVAHPENWERKDQFAEMQGKLWKVTEIDPEDEWPIKVTAIEQPDWGYGKPIETSFKVTHIEKVEIPESTSDDEATNEARKLLALPKLKLPGAAQQDLTVEAKKKIQARVQPHYDAAYKRAAAALDKAIADLPKWEKEWDAEGGVGGIYVHGHAHVPFQTSSGAGIGYLYVPSLKKWVLASNPRWGDGYGRGEDRVYAKTGGMFSMTPVDEIKSANFASSEEVTRALLGSIMRGSAVDVFLRDKDGEILGYSAPGNENLRFGITDKMRKAAGNWLGYGPKITRSDIASYLMEFDPGQTITRPDGPPELRGMYIKTAIGDWEHYRELEDASGWENVPDRVFSPPEMVPENEDWLRAHLEAQGRSNQAHAFSEEIKETVAAQLPKDPEKLVSNGAPGPLYVKQHKEIMRVGALLDKKFQDEWLQRSAAVPDVAAAEAARTEAENALAQERLRLRMGNSPVALDLLIDEVATEGNLSKEDAEMAVLFSYSRSYGGPAAVVSQNMTYAQWKEDPSGEWDFLAAAISEGVGREPRRR